MPLYEVSMTVVAIVEADEEDFAADVAHENRRDIFSEGFIDITVIGEVKSMDDVVRIGWDGLCLPYGGDGESRIEKLLVPETL